MCVCHASPTQHLVWLLLLIGSLVGLGAWLVVAQEDSGDRTAASLAEEIKQEVVSARYELD